MRALEWLASALPPFPQANMPVLDSVVFWDKYGHSPRCRFLRSKFLFSN
jgi:hypothetical protein